MEQCFSPCVCVCVRVCNKVYAQDYIIRKDAGWRVGKVVVEGAGPIILSRGSNKTCNDPVADDVVSKVIKCVYTAHPLVAPDDKTPPVSRRHTTVRRSETVSLLFVLRWWLRCTQVHRYYIMYYVKLKTKYFRIWEIEYHHVKTLSKNVHWWATK